MYSLKLSMEAAEKAAAAFTKGFVKLHKTIKSLNRDPHFKRVRHLATHSKKWRVRKKNRKRFSKILKEGLRNENRQCNSR